MNRARLNCEIATRNNCDTKNFSFIGRVRFLPPLPAIARDAAGRVVADVHLRGPNAYTLTGDLMAWGARQLAAGRAREAGVVSPIQAFGLDDFETACAAVGLVRA